MTPERWRQVDEVVQRALDREPERRAEVVRRACGGDRELLEEAVGLLEADRLAGDFLAVRGDPRDGEDTGGGACAVASEADDFVGGKPGWAPAPGEPGPGGWMGPYRLLRPIGHGGMAVVYLAERDDGSYRKRVAIKVVRRDLDPALVESRFRAERQILAGLDHPSIARLLDGGTTEEGLSYLVMEYVEGEPIDAYCDRRRLDVSARLRLFLEACTAVEHAHRNLIVHRDLKPTNVLVTGEGTPKLLDFGVAKLLSPPEATSATEPTATGRRPMTLSYASPEQLAGRRVTTASDVYSLGVVLYRLLSGGLPRRFSGVLPADLAEMLREPVPPSRAVEQGSAAGDWPAARRGVSAGQLVRRLQGDLDNVVLKALRGDPERRYASVAELAEDVRRHLEGRPVRARPASWRYVAGKFVRRNRIASAATAAVVALVLAFTGVLALQRGELARERDRAQAAREQAQQVTDLVVGMFDEVAPERARGQEPTVREVLDRRAETLAEEFADQPELLATLQAEIGDLYRRIGAYGEARALLEEALRRREELLGPDHPRVAETLSDLSAVHAIEGDVPGAGELLERSLAIFRETPPADQQVLVRTLGRLAILRSRLGDAEASEALSREVLAIQERRFGETSAPVAHALHNLAIHKARHGEIDEAHKLFTRTLAVQQALLPDDDPNLLRTHQNLGLLLRHLGAHGEAREHLERAFEGAKRVYAPDHDEIAAAALNLGDLCRLTGELERAEALYRRALESYERSFGPGHPVTATILHSQGRLALDRGRTPEAEHLFRAALELRRRAPTGPGHELVDDLTRLAEVVRRSGRLDEAESLLAEARGVGGELPPGRWASGALARAHLATGDLHLQRDRPGPAADSWRRAAALAADATPSVADRRVRAEALERLAEHGDHAA